VHSTHAHSPLNLKPASEISPLKETALAAEQTLQRLGINGLSRVPLPQFTPILPEWSVNANSRANLHPNEAYLA
jgi:hypothetical protein